MKRIAPRWKCADCPMGDGATVQAGSADMMRRYAFIQIQRCFCRVHTLDVKGDKRLFAWMRP